MVMFWLVIAGLDGWWASGWTPPTTMPAPESSLKVLPDTVTPEAPSPTPEAWAFASLPMPRPTWPRWEKVSPVKVMPLAAETCTAAGTWLQLLRAASKSWHPDWQDVMKSEGCEKVRPRNAPLCWSA